MDGIQEDVVAHRIDFIESVSRLISALFCPEMLHGLLVVEGFSTVYFKRLHKGTWAISTRCIAKDAVEPVRCPELHYSTLCPLADAFVGWQVGGLCFCHCGLLKLC